MPRGARMAIHKFKIGETVFLEHSLDVPGGAYVVTKRCQSATASLISNQEPSGGPSTRCSREPAKRRIVGLKTVINDTALY